MSVALQGDDERRRAASAALHWLATLWSRRDSLTVDQELLVGGCWLLGLEWAGAGAGTALGIPGLDPDRWQPPSGGDPYLGLVVTSLRSRRAGDRNGRQASAARVAAALPTAVTDAPAALRRTASLLHVLGEETELGTYRRDLPTIETLYEMDAEQVEQTCHDLAVGTRFGAAPGALGEALRADLELPLSAIALAYLRDYRLDLGCLAVRTLRYLDVGVKAIAQATAFLLLQQQARGCFGFLSQPGLLRLRERGADLDLEVFLPTTFECLWTLAVVDGDCDPVHSPGAEPDR